MLGAAAHDLDGVDPRLWNGLVMFEKLRVRLLALLAASAASFAMPANIGNPFRTKERSVRANTNGSTGRMQGLMMGTPPR
jgi:hypothetical protein